MIRLNFESQEESITIIKDNKTIYVYTLYGNYTFHVNNILPNYKTLLSNETTIKFIYVVDKQVISKIPSYIISRHNVFFIYLLWDDYELVTNTFRKWKTNRSTTLEL